MDIYYSYKKAAKVRSEFFKIINIQDAQFYYRLALLCNAQKYLELSKDIPLGSSAALDPFLWEINEGNYQPLSENSLNFTVSLVEEILELAGEDPASLAHVVYLGNIDAWHTQKIAQICAALKGFADYSVKYKNIVITALTHSNYKQRVHALEILRQCNAQVAHFAREIVDCAISSGKLERELAEVILKQDIDAVIPYLKLQAEKGKASERLYAVKLLVKLTGEQAKSFLQQRLTVEKAEKVRDIIEKALATPEICSSIKYTLPPLPEIKLDVPLAESVIRDLEVIVDQVKLEVLKAVNYVLDFEQDSSWDLRYELSDKLSSLSNWFSIDVVQKAREIRIEVLDQSLEGLEQFKLLIQNSEPKQINTKKL